MPAQERMEELGHRLSINSLNKKWSREEWASIIAAQISVEEKIEAALLDDGFSPDAIFAKRHQIRGFMFYPGGTSLTEPTYVGYVRSIDNLGTRASVPYKRWKTMIYRSVLLKKIESRVREGEKRDTFYQSKADTAPPMLPRSAYRGIERKDPGPEQVGLG